MIRRSLLLCASLLAGWPQSTSAEDLTDQQRTGRQVFAQACGVCHLPPALGARTYGPLLNKASGNGDDELMREYILSGTPRMPAFKHYLNVAEVDAIIAYVRTVPASASR